MNYDEPDEFRGGGGAWKNPPSIQSCTSRFIPGCTAGDLLESCLEHAVSSVEKSDVFPPATVENAGKSTRTISLKVDESRGIFRTMWLWISQQVIRTS